MKINKVLPYLCLLVFCLFYSASHTQILGRNSINTLGKSTASNNGMYFSQSIGQASNTSSEQNNSLYYCQGFQQPISNTIGKQLNFQVYPNPSQGEITISLNSSENLFISLYDQQGKLIYNCEKKGGYTYQINLADIASGFYQLQIRSAKDSFNTKLIIH